jgi:tetratricopeptide (TPR) repeat protein
MISINQKFYIFNRLTLTAFLLVSISGCTYVDTTYKKYTSSKSLKGEIYPAPYQGKIFAPKTWASSFQANKSFNQDLQFATQQFNLNNFSISEFYLKKTLVKEPDNSIAIKLLPWAYFYQNRYDKALKAFDRTKAYYKKQPELFIGKGWCYFALKNYKSSIEQFEYAEKLKGDPHQIMKAKGFIYLETKRISEAQKEFSKIYSPIQIDTIFAKWDDWRKNDTNMVIDVLPDHPEAYSLFTLQAEHPRYSSILLGLPNNNNPAIDKAWNSFNNGSYKKSLEEFEDIANIFGVVPPLSLSAKIISPYFIGIDSGSPDLQNGLAWSYLKNKNIKTASNIFIEILNKWPNFIGALKGIKEIEKIKRNQARHADQYLELNKLKIAEIKYKELQGNYPDWIYLHTQLGRLNLEREDYLKARDYFLDALDITPNDTSAKNGIAGVREVLDSELYEADQALNAGDYKTSAILYAGYIDDYSPNVSSILNLSTALGFNVDPWDTYYEKKNDYLNNGNDVSLFTQLLDKVGLSSSTKNKPLQAISPSKSSLAHAYNGLGWSQYHKKKYLQASKKFIIARTDREYFNEASRGLGLALYEAGKFRHAANALKIAFKAYPEELSLAYKLDMSILMSWDNETAKKYFTENLVYYPLRSSLYMGLGWINYRNKNPDLGIEYFLKAISLDPNFALTDEFRTLLAKERFGWQVYNRFGWAYYQKQDYKNAFTMFQESSKKMPNKSESLKGLGYTLGKIGKLAESAKYLNQALALNVDPTPVKEMISGNDAIAPYLAVTTARTTLGNIIIDDNPNRAIALFKSELNLRPNLAAAHDGLGWAYLQINHLTESRIAFMTALKNQPLNNRSHKGLKEVKQKIANINLNEGTMSLIKK